MKNLKFIIYILFTVIISFSFMSNVEAKRANNVWCVYNVKECTLALKKNLSGTNGSNGGWSIDSSKMTRNCMKIGDNTVRFLVPNVYNNKSFYYDLNYNGAQQNKTCPDLYMGTTLQNCWKSKTDELSMNHGDKCLMLYTENNENGSRVKVTGEKMTTKDFKEQAQDNGGKAQADKIKALEKMTVGDKVFSCEKLLGDDFIDILNIIFTFIRVSTPIILIVLTMVDFMIAIVSEDGTKRLNDQFQKFIKRSIAAALVFLAPTIIDFILNITGITDGTCGL